MLPSIKPSGSVTVNCIAVAPFGVVAPTVSNALLPGEYVGTDGKSSAARAAPTPKKRNAAITMINFIDFIALRLSDYDFPVIDHINARIIYRQGV